MKTIELSLARNYVSSWSTVDAVRELIANALDEGDPYIDTIGDDEIIIETETGKIPIEYLLMGSGSKTEGTDTIGQFNEGLKLALLIIARNDLPHVILNGDEQWEVYIAKSNTFGIDCLHIDITENTYNSDTDKVRFEISGLRSVLGDIKSKNLCFQEDLDVISTDNGDIIKNDHLKGQIFCGGVWVCEDLSFDYGYNFTTDVLKLDRDRRKVSTFDLAWQTKELWNLVDSEEDEEELVEAILKDKYDAKYVNGSMVSTEVANRVLERATKDLDEDTVLTGDWAEYDNLRESKVKVKYISSDAIASVITKATNYKKPQEFIKIEKPMDILVDFHEKWSDNMDSDLESAFSELIDKLDGLI
jgi:hypothetical protein